MLISWAWQQYQHASEVAVGFAIIAFWRNLSSPTALSVVQIKPGAPDQTYKLPGSHVWAVLSSEKSRSPAYQGEQFMP